jgi:hypothetical protein
MRRLRFVFPHGRSRTNLTMPDIGIGHIGILTQSSTVSNSCSVFSIEVISWGCNLDCHEDTICAIIWLKFLYDNILSVLLWKTRRTTFFTRKIVQWFAISKDDKSFVSHLSANRRYSKSILFAQDIMLCIETGCSSSTPMPPFTFEPHAPTGIC